MFFLGTDTNNEHVAKASMRVVYLCMTKRKPLPERKLIKSYMIPAAEDIYPGKNRVQNINLTAKRTNRRVGNIK